MRSILLIAAGAVVLSLVDHRRGHCHAAVPGVRRHAMGVQPMNSVFWHHENERQQNVARHVGGEE